MSSAASVIWFTPCLRHLASGGLLVHFLLLITWLAKKGAFTRQCHPLASVAVPALGGAVQAVEGEGGWGFKNLFCLAMILAQDFMIDCREGGGLNKHPPPP